MTGTKIELRKGLSPCPLVQILKALNLKPGEAFKWNYSDDFPLPP